MHIKICINSVKIPNHIFNTYVEYKFFDKTYRTQMVILFKIYILYINIIYIIIIKIQVMGNDNPVYYGYEKVHTIKEVDDYSLIYLAKT